MKKWKRILSAVLVCAMVLPLATTYVNADANDSNSTENVVWFTEDFKGTTDDIGVNGTGWNNLGNFTLDTANEVLKSKTSGQYIFLNQQQAMSWSNYTVEADVVVTNEVIGSYTATGRWGGIVAAVSDCSRTGGNAGSGYEFMICYNKDGSTYCALKDRNGTSSGSANVDYAFNLNTSYNLKMELSGNKITCYINDQPVISNHQINITGDLTGSVGFHSAGQYCTFDNVKVYTKGLLFNEEFVGTTNDIGVNGTGWNNLGNFTLDTSAQKLKSKTSGQYSFLNRQEALSWTDYTVEADVVVTDEVIGSYTATGRWGGIVAAVTDCSRTGSNAGSGYEFMICYNKDGSTYCALKDRSGTSSGSANVDYAFNLNTSYNLKMELKGNKITCYINDQPVITNHQINITGDLTGSIGVHSAGQYCTFDNIRVWENQPEVETVAETIWFVEDFNGTTGDIGVNGIGWNNLGNFTLDTDAQKLKSKTSGQYSFLNREEAMDWKNYTVEADVVVTSEVIGSYTASGRWGGIVAAVTDCTRTGSNAGSGYEFMICYNKDGSTYCALKDRSGTSSGSANVDYTFELDKVYTLKMVLTGNVINCYIDDDHVIKNHQINIEGDLTGTVGVHSAGQYCTFDNIVVRENGLMFHEKFANSVEETEITGWNNLGNFILDAENEVLKSKTSGQYTFLNKEKAMSWTNYTVEADVVVTDEVIGSYTASGRWGGIVAAVTDCSRTGGNAGSGYEFMICYNKDGSTYCALKDRSGTSSGSANIPYEFELNETYTLKMELDGNKINCYINNELVIEEHAITIQGDLTGTIGLHSAGQYCTFDNINVWENTNLNDDEDNKDEDNKEDLEDGLWFKETFSGINQDLVSAGWDTGKTAILTAEKQLELSAKANSSMYLNGHDGASEWTNYTAEVDVIITDTEIAGNTANNRVAGLIVAANSKKLGYELMIGYIPAKDIYFYQLKDRITGTNLTAEIAYPFELNEVVNLKMVLVGNTIECYIDGELETTCEVEGVKSLKGTIGVHGVGNVTKFDNILVYESKPSYKLPPLTDVTGSDVWFEDDFSSTDSLMKERGWSKEYQIHDGRVCMPNNNEVTAYITGIEKANLWKDYTAETEVYIADDPSVIPTILNPAAFLCVRSTSEKSGYDFGVIWNNGEDIGWVRLRDRTTSTTLAENKNIKIEKDKTYQLKMSVKGNQIDCYLDGELVMSATDTKNSNPTGTVGIRKNGYLTYFDNVVVYKTNRYQSPQTGDMNYVYLYVLVLCTSATLYATIVYRRKNKQNV